jgi:site-specific DNA-methyltransferase (adenine-specific)
MYGDRQDKTPDGRELPVPPETLDHIFCASSESMNELPERSVHLLITSPPYNAGKEYDNDLTLEEYRQLLRRVFAESYRVLVGGGRLCVNVANLGRKPYLPLHAFLIEDLLDLGYLMRGEIIWNKASSASPSTAWGSWQSASNPVLRDVHEYILIFSKESFARRRGNRVNTIRREDFLEWTKSVWTFPAVSARKIGHPAPFPEELPARLIELLSFRGDVVLDPFCGSGTTCLAARKAGRHFVGYDLDPRYVELALKRLAADDPAPRKRGPRKAGAR